MVAKVDDWLSKACLAAAPLVGQVEQAELERFDGVAPGKYTSGLGQRRMAFCTDQEDVVSISLTAVKRLLEKYDVDPRDIGRCIRGPCTGWFERKAGASGCPLNREVAVNLGRFCW